MRAILRIERISLRMHAPLLTAGGSLPTREGARVWLTAEDGTVGQGEAMPLERFGTGTLAQTLEALQSLSLSPLGIPDRPEQLETLLAPLDGLPAARHALELAALDLQARREGLSISRLLATIPETSDDSGGGSAPRGLQAPASSIPVNALLSAEAPDALVAQGRAAVGEGAKTLKVKVAYGPLAQDVERLRALRDAVGPEVRLRLDANGGWTRAEAARALLGLHEACAPELVEQPVAPSDAEGMLTLRREKICRIGADESLAPPARAAALIEAGIADAVILKPMVLGGLLPALRLGHLARARGLHVIVTSSLDGVIARAGAAHLAAVIGEPEWAHGLWVGPLFVDEPRHPYAPVRGTITLPSEPGLGIDPDVAGQGGSRA